MADNELPKSVVRHTRRNRPRSRASIYADPRIASRLTKKGELPVFLRASMTNILKGTTRKHLSIKHSATKELLNKKKELLKNISKRNKTDENNQKLGYIQAGLNIVAENSEYSNLSNMNEYSPGEQKRHKNILSPADPYNEEILTKRLNSYRKFITDTIEMNKILVDTIDDPKRKKEKIIRQSNIPEDISENIAKYIIRNKLGKKKIVWAKMVGKTGDLVIGHNIVEVKAFTSDGPSSFGPKKIFDIIYFLDLRKWLENKIVLWEVSLTNNSSEWKNIKMNEEETHEQSAEAGKRPHISWENIKSQIPLDKYKCVYEGTFEGIFTPSTAEPACQQ